jgi:prophage antirepressor-like protein
MPMLDKKQANWTPKTNSAVCPKNPSGSTTMNHNIQTFTFTPDLSIRAIIKDGKPWFLAKEVCAALGLTNVSQSLANSVDPEDKSQISLGLPGSAPLVVSESGLYSLIMRSRKIEAKPFQKWVTGTALPTLRIDGVYITGQEKPLTDDLTLAALLVEMAGIQVKVDSIKEAKLRTWSRHQEEKEARRDAFQFLKGKSSGMGTAPAKHSSR